METTMRHRIIGTLVWLSLAIIVLPFVLDGGGMKDLEAAQNQTINTPVPLTVKPIVLQPVDTGKVIELAPEAVTEVDITPANAQQSSSKPVLDAQGLPQSWVVQLASFKSATNAKTLRNKLIKAKYAAYLRTSGDNYRIFVGPVNTRDEAEKLKAKLKKGYKLSGFIVTYKVDQ
ncbi:MAG TPA: hypothetical protein DE179_03215 [Oceanospirillaceae bacterium]|nr:hypothetical protein [Oceanospirillaceae bacterium]